MVQQERQTNKSDSNIPPLLNFVIKGNNEADSAHKNVCKVLTLPRKMMQIKLMQAAVIEVIVDDH